MSTPTLTIPPLECPAVLLPTPANLANYFKGLASHAYTYDIEEIKDILENLKPIFEPFDPKFKKLEIQEIEWEIRIQGLVDEFSSYVQAQMLDIVASLTPSIDLDIDNLYELLPPEYKLYKDKFDSLDFKKKTVKDYFKEKVKEFQTGNFIQGLKDLGLGFTLPTDPREAVKLAIQTIISDTEKDIEQQIEDLKNIQVGPFTIEQILGGEIREKVEISEFQRDRLIKKLLSFAQDYFAYLVKEALSKITDAIKTLAETVGSALEGIIAFFTFDFCKFLEIIGVPKTIQLPAGIQEVTNTVQNPLPNAITVEEGR